MTNLISVIVPVYNAGSYLQPLIDSVLKQTWSKLELILVDDGSNDGSADVCDAAAKQDSRVCVLHKENGGQSAARNAGLAIARGEYIAFADHDDLLHPRMYEYMMGAMRENNTQVCSCSFRNVQQKDVESICFCVEKPTVSVIECEQWLEGLFEPTWRTPIWNKLYHKSIFEGIKFGSFRLGEDNLLSYQIFKKTQRTAFVHKELYFQRMHGDNFEFVGICYFTDLLRAKELILNDVALQFPTEYTKFQKLFLYECIRIYNNFVEQNSPGFEEQKKETLELIKRNSKGIWMSNMPIGHKILFSKLNLLHKGCHMGKIII